MGNAWEDKKNAQRAPARDVQIELHDFAISRSAWVTFGRCSGEREERIKVTNAGKTKAHERVETSW